MVLLLYHIFFLEPTNKIYLYLVRHIQNNSFTIYGENCKFYWLVQGKRCDNIFRRLNFTSYCRGKATLEQICRNITKDKKTLIGFGDYSQPSPSSKLIIKSKPEPLYL